MTAARHRHGPSGAFDVSRLVRQHQTGLWRFLRALGCDPAAAEEIAQDTFVTVLRRPFEVVDDRSAAAYLRTVAKRLLWKRRRRTGRPPTLAPEAIEAAFVAEGGDEADAIVETLRRCVARLDERDRALVDAHYRDGVSRAELARRFDMSEDGVKSWMRRVRGGLRACLERAVPR